jgi:3-hydroxyisobutyrate dehydrogenase
MKRIGFVGIGNMGWPMAANLVKAGFAVTVADARPGRAATFAADVGGLAAADNVELARSADAIVTMLPTSAHVAEVLRALATALPAGAVVVEMSSGDPTVTRSLATTLREHGVALVDCPVSGGVARAVTGDLSIMAGGDPDVLDRVKPLLDAVASTVHRCGSVGAGHAMKALNNLVSAGGFLIALEALIVGRSFGLQPDRMVEVLNASTGANNSTEKKLRQFVLSRSYDSGFGLDLMAKDLGIASALASAAGVVAPFSSLCTNLWSGATNMLGPDCDHTEMARFSEAISGHRVG